MENLDIAVVSIIAASGLFAFIRGFTREVLSIVAWLGAIAVAFYTGPLVRPTVDSFVPESWRKVVDSFYAYDIPVFLVAIILFSLIVGIISSQIKKTALGALDRTLGLLFGVARGALIVCLVYLVGSRMLKDDQPDWLLKARSRPLLAYGAEQIEQLMPSRATIERNLPGAAPPAEHAADKANTLMQAGTAAQGLNDALDRLTGQPQPKPAQRASDPNNPEANSDSKGLDQLIQAQGAK
jgi:membrane protein required for colicin V production